MVYPPQGPERRDLKSNNRSLHENVAWLKSEPRQRRMKNKSFGDIHEFLSCHQLPSFDVHKRSALTVQRDEEMWDRIKKGVTGDHVLRHCSRITCLHSL